MILKKIKLTSAFLIVMSLPFSAVGCALRSSEPEKVLEKESDTEEPNNPIIDFNYEEGDSGDTQTQISHKGKTNSETIIESINTIEDEKESVDLNLTDRQKNSFSMLYYLAITAEEIRTSRDNRLMLDDIYTSLLNDINPGSIDETTQSHLQNLRDIIKSYRNISVKRERLQYLYNQNKASAMRSAVPNPIGILSMTNAIDWKKLAVSVVYTVVDSYNNYKGALEAASQEYLISGWELDDEETEAIQKNRERAFDYMVDIVQEYELDGTLTLNEKAIETFAEICAIDSVQQKIRRLESEHETYQLLGNYWLELADSYFETEEYEKCLECVDKYYELSTGIYRKDTKLVQILPKAVVAAQELYSDDRYITTVSYYADDILKNTTTEEWSARYFAAQAYLDLFSRTGDRSYIEKAYDIAYDNVTILLDEQVRINETYLSEVQEVTVAEPNYKYMSEAEKEEAKKEYDAEKDRAEHYNEQLNNKRKTELPSLYEPLIINCDLLFALSEELEITNKEKEEIEAILQTSSNGVFLTNPINDRYSFSSLNDNFKIKCYRDSLVIPVSLLTDTAEFEIMIEDGGEKTYIDDCVISKVSREGDSIETFEAHVSSKAMDSYSWTEDSKIMIYVYYAKDNDPIIFKFRVSEYKNAIWPMKDKVKFEEI